MLPYPCGPRAGRDWGGLSGLENVFSIFPTSHSMFMSQVVPMHSALAAQGGGNSQNSLIGEEAQVQ